MPVPWLTYLTSIKPLAVTLLFLILMSVSPLALSPLPMPEPS